MTVLMKVADIAKRLAGAKSALEEVHQAAVGMLREHADLHQERSRLINAKPPREDLIAALDEQVRALGEAWAEANGARVVAALSGGVEVSMRGEVTGIRPGALAVEFGGPVDLSMLAALSPDTVRERLAGIVLALEYEAGPPMRERARLVAEVDTRLARVERAHAELVDEAARAGISLAHMDGERARRVQKAQRREAADRFNRANEAAIRRGAVQPMPVE